MEKVEPLHRVLFKSLFCYGKVNGGGMTYYSTYVWYCSIRNSIRSLYMCLHMNSQIVEKQNITISNTYQMLTFFHYSLFAYIMMQNMQF